MKTRALAYDAARALPVYPTRAAALAVVAMTAAVVATRYGPPGFALVLVPALLALAAGGSGWWDAIRRSLLPLAFAAVCLFVAIRLSSSALLWLAVLGWLLVTAWWVLREVVPSQTNNGILTRRTDREQRAGGVASTWDVMQNASAAEVRRQAVVLRPSLAAVPPRRRRAEDVGYLIATNGAGTRWGQQLWSTSRDHTLRIGAPGTNKSISLAVHGLDAPGALITTSTRPDLARNVHIARRIDPLTGLERVVHVFNPAGMENVPSTITWSVLIGCEDYTTAARMASHMIPESRSIDGERWDKMARATLPVMLHAAAVSRRSMGDVLRWVTLMSYDSGRDRARGELVDILIPQPNGPAVIDYLDSFLSAPDKGRGSAMMMMTAALSWMNDAAARQVGDAPVHTVKFNPRQLLLDRETLHIISPGQVGGIMSPLNSALVGEVAHQVTVLAAGSPGGRLDPPATALLDEAARTVRLPLDDWTSDMGGVGLTLHISVQSLSQLRKCWGDDGAGELKGNAGTLIVFGGGMDADQLEDVSLLCGTRWRRNVNDQTKRLGRLAGVQRGELSEVRVLTAAQLCQMPRGQAAIIKRNLGGTFIGRPPTVLERDDWRSLNLDGSEREAFAPAHLELVQSELAAEAERESA